MDEEKQAKTERLNHLKQLKVSFADAVMARRDVASKLKLIDQRLIELESEIKKLEKE